MAAPLTIDGLNQAVALASLLDSLKALQARASGPAVQFVFHDGQGASPVFADSGFTSALSDFIAAQIVDVMNRLAALGVNAS